MISVDEGATYEYVLNDAGEKIKAAGSEANVEEAIGNYVKVDEEGYICIGEYKTSFKYNANIPSMIYNEKDGTMQVTIGGQSYTLLMEGSAFNGLQSIAFRKPYADNSTVGSSEVAKLDIYNWFKRLMALGGNTERQPEKMKNTIAKTGKTTQYSIRKILKSLSVW